MCIDENVVLIRILYTQLSSLYVQIWAPTPSNKKSNDKKLALREFQAKNE